MWSYGKDMKNTNTTKVEKAIEKAIKAGKLAVSAEKIGNELEAEQAANTCGRIAADAGISLDHLWGALPGINNAGLSWNCMVDAWYDAQVPKAA